MLRCLKEKKAQAIMGEYAMLFFLVMATVIAMMVYFKRAIQVRIYEAHNYMVEQAQSRTAGDFNGTFYKEYEPYYANTSAIVTRDINEETYLDEGASSGIFRKDYNTTISVAVNSETAPPRGYGD
jgi:hypothetical protein